MEMKERKEEGGVIFSYVMNRWVLNLYKKADVPKGIEPDNFMSCPLSGLIFSFKIYLIVVVVIVYFIAFLSFSHSNDLLFSSPPAHPPPFVPLVPLVLLCLPSTTQNRPRRHTTRRPIRQMRRPHLQSERKRRKYPHSL